MASRPFTILKNGIQLGILHCVIQYVMCSGCIMQNEFDIFCIQYICTLQNYHVYYGTMQFQTSLMLLYLNHHATTKSEHWEAAESQ